MTTTRVVALGEQECRELLAQMSVGRIGVSLDALPVILPVTYAVLDGSIYFRTDEGSAVARATADTIVAFEAGSYDLETGSGWSVLVQGRSSAVSGSPTSSALLASIPDPIGSPGDATRVVQIAIAVISGRRIEPQAISDLLIS